VAGDDPERTPDISGSCWYRSIEIIADKNHRRYEFNTFIAQTLNNWGASGREKCVHLAGYGGKE
jgi:hypothetical protein